LNKTEHITTKAGDFEVKLLTFGDSKIWVADNFPFPVKAQTVLEELPLPYYEFELLGYSENVISNPFEPLS